jgi:hypothetical protein
MLENQPALVEEAAFICPDGHFLKMIDNEFQI